MEKQISTPRGSWVTAAVMALFGFLTLVASSSVLFNIDGMAAEAGHFAPLVLWMNFFASFLYIVAAYGLLTHRTWTPFLLLVAIALLVIAAIGFFIHIWTGGAYEHRTIGALAFRIFATALLYWAARYYLRPLNTREETKHIL